jgi:hypothetical protein
MRQGFLNYLHRLASNCVGAGGAEGGGVREGAGVRGEREKKFLIKISK